MIDKKQIIELAELYAIQERLGEFKAELEKPDCEVEGVVISLVKNYSDSGHTGVMDMYIDNPSLFIQTIQFRANKLVADAELELIQEINNVSA